MKKLTFEVDGMHCGMCEAHVNDAVRKVNGVKKAESSHTDRRTVVIAEETADCAEIKAAIEKEGYRVGTSSEEEYKKRGIFFKK